MSGHKAHQSQTHMHEHGPYCAHLAVDPGGHRDFLHDAKLHRGHGEKVETHSLEVNAENPARCTPAHSCATHEADHEHGPSGGHEAIPRGDHRDYLVRAHVHDSCGQHGEDPGSETTAERK